MNLQKVLDKALEHMSTQEYRDKLDQEMRRTFTIAQEAQQIFIYQHANKGKWNCKIGKYIRK